MKKFIFLKPMFDANLGFLHVIHSFVTKMAPGLKGWHSVSENGLPNSNVCSNDKIWFSVARLEACRQHPGAMPSKRSRVGF